MNKKVIYQFSIISLVLTLIVCLLGIYSFKDNTSKLAVYNAKLISEVVKKGLNSHIINDNMNQSDTFINSISSMKDIEDLWLVRSEAINKQFGKNEKREAKDSIDEKVLKTGKTEYKINETSSKTTMRITIPYKAVWENGIDCTKCHNVSSGDVLGAISLEYDISDLEQTRKEKLYLIPLVVFLGLMLLLFLFISIFKQYLMIFETLDNNLRLAVLGKFEKIKYPKGLSKNMIDLMELFNSLMGSLKDTSNDIDKKLKGFIGKVSDNKSNSLEDSKEIVSNLSNLYQFKKEIEQDNCKEEIYNRVSQILINKFKIKNFNILEIDTLKKKMEIIKQVGDAFYCKKNLEESPDQCRAVRTKNDVLSMDYHATCPYFTEKDRFHYCLNVEITKNIYLVINFVFNLKEELEYLKEKISFVKSYINESIPSIEVKLLMSALQESAFRDGLTGLYNRKFLEENSKTLIPQAKRENYNIGVLLLDMDHFKAVNDEYGHDIGDKVLKELSRILVETVRESDIIIRYGGEEFLVLLVNVKTDNDALNVANKIRTKVQENEIDIYAGSKLRKTVSIGISMFPKDASNLDAVIKNADIALYEAKNKGRNKVVLFQPEQVSSVDLF